MKLTLQFLCAAVGGLIFKMENCQFCGKEFIKTISYHKYCGVNCRVKAYRKNNPIKIKEIDRKARKKWKLKNYSKVKEGRRRHESRERGLGYVEIMDNPFPNEIFIIRHHINNIFVMPMPQKLHEISSANKYKKRHKIIANTLIQKLGFDLSLFIPEGNKD